MKIIALLIAVIVAGCGTTQLRKDLADQRDQNEKLRRQFAAMEKKLETAKSGESEAPAADAAEDDSTDGTDIVTSVTVPQPAGYICQINPNARYFNSARVEVVNGRSGLVYSNPVWLLLTMNGKPVIVHDGAMPVVFPGTNETRLPQGISCQIEVAGVYVNGIRQIYQVQAQAVNQIGQAMGSTGVESRALDSNGYASVTFLRDDLH
jgi:hypothetical protein